ncbi:MAG: Omp28 family outer membrane lipoprotein [Bacteroidota bacterium]
MKKVLFLLPLMFIVLSCEVIEAPYFEPEYLSSLPADEKCLLAASEDEPFPDGYVYKKKVLLEEMTGHQCGNCPNATKEAVKLKEEHGDDLVFISIHAGPLANVKTTGTKYTSDYNTEEGTEWYTTLNDRNAVPFGMVDRSSSGTNAKEWTNFVTSSLAEPAIAGIRITICYEPDSTELGVVIDVKFAEGASSSERLSVVMVEDQIVDWQKDYSSTTGSPDIPDYTHHDILRATLNGTWGEPLSASDIQPNATFTKSYGFELNPEWDPANCKIIAFLHDFDSKTVHQVAVASLQ